MKETSFASNADDNTLYVTAENLDDLISLEETHTLGRKSKKRVTNSRAAARKSWTLRCSPRTPRFFPKQLFLTYCQPTHFHFVFILFSLMGLLILSWIFTTFPAHEAKLGPKIFVHLQSDQLLF